MKALILGSVCCIALTGCDNIPGTKEHQIKVAEDAVAALMKDPSSAQFRNIVSGDGVLCGEINAKNSFGAYGGFEEFYVLGDHASLRPNHNEFITNQNLAAWVREDFVFSSKHWDEAYELCRTGKSTSAAQTAMLTRQIAEQTQADQSRPSSKH